MNAISTAATIVAALHTAGLVADLDEDVSTRDAAYVDAFDGATIYSITIAGRGMYAPHAIRLPPGHIGHDPSAPC